MVDKGPKGERKILRTLAVLSNSAWEESNIYDVHAQSNLGVLRFKIKIGSLDAIWWRVAKDNFGDGIQAKPLMVSDIASDGKVSHRSEYHEILKADFVGADGVTGYAYREFPLPKCAHSFRIDVIGVGTVTGSELEIEATAGDQ